MPDDLHPMTAAGTPAGEGQPSGVPVVDITRMVARVYQDAHRMRQMAHTLSTEATVLLRQAEDLEALASLLAGEGP